MSKTTIKDLESLCERINVATNSPLKPYAKLKSGEFRANAQIGCYLLDGAYGGYKLARITNKGGGQTDITQGYDPKSILWDKMYAFLNGVEAGRKPPI